MSLSYRSRNRIKLAFFILAIVIIASLFGVLNHTVQDIRHEERKKILLWADAVQQRNTLLEYTAQLFEKLEQDELQKVELWRESQQLIMEVDDPQFLSFLLKIISTNQNIPIILTDAQKRVISTMNVGENIVVGRTLPPSMIEQFSKYEPLLVTYQGKLINYLYYSDSQLFNELQLMLNELIHSFVVEVVQNSASVPVIITNSDTTEILACGNIPERKINKARNESVKKFIQENLSENPPIKIILNQKNEGYIFYNNSPIITQLTYYPPFLLLVSILLGFIAYYTLRSFEKNEKDQLWVGMSKETAHQLGTPISSLMAWIEILKMNNVDSNTLDEINKDVNRLETIACRFSKIGSTPDFSRENVGNVVENAVNYMRNRTSQNIESSIHIADNDIYAMVNISLLGWVIENLWKNAVDAMQGKGTLTINVSKENNHVCIDVSDTGKGLPRNKFKTIFQPGYTTKSRGWGLGLSLAQRIVKEYHHGKIMVKSSEIDKGTTFRICLPLVK